MIKAEAVLGEIFDKGNGVEADYTEAVKWYRLAAREGDEDSAIRLAAILFSGKGVAHDVPEAIRLWTWAADKGNAFAQFSLAQRYADGAGVPRDLSKARELFVLAGKKLDVSRELDALSRQERVTEAMETQPETVK
jgi:TPR repeat protein